MPRHPREMHMTSFLVASHGDLPHDVRYDCRKRSGLLSRWLPRRYRQGCVGSLREGVSIKCQLPHELVSASFQWDDFGSVPATLSRTFSEEIAADFRRRLEGVPSATRCGS